MPFVPPPPLPAVAAGAMPFERRAYRLERGAYAGRLLHFVDHGPRGGRPVLLLHGNPTWSFLWRKAIARLPELRCVAPDLLGFGLSETLPRIADHSLDGHAAAVGELAAALDLTGTILVGQDWGGPVGAVTAAGAPERFAGLVLANTAVVLPAKLRGTAFHRFARLPVASDLAFRLLGFPLRSLHRAQGDPSSMRGAAGGAYRAVLRGWRRRGAPLALARMVPDGEEHASVPALRRGEAWARGFAGPAALVWGTRDPILGRSLARHRRAFPAAPVTATPAGHFLQEEVPGELAAAIRGVAGRLDGEAAGS